MNLLVVPILVPLVAAGLCLLLRDRLQTQRVIGGVALHSLLGISGYLLLTSLGGEVRALSIGGWEDSYGITFAVDTFSAIMLTISAFSSTAAWWFIVLGAANESDQHRFIHPLYLFLVSGVNWAFTTADIFNLFVSFELILLASYGLIIHGNREAPLREGTKYVVLNVIVGMFFLAAAGLIYGAFGTLNMAELAILVRETEQLVLAICLGSLLLVVFATKAASFPLFFWMPDAYPRAPIGVVPFFSAILTKGGVYALYRTFTMTFNIHVEDWFQPLLLTLGGLSMIVGVLGALSQWTFRRILAFHSISQIGYMIFALGMLSPLALAGGIFYIIHHAVIKSTLFMTGGTVVLRLNTDYIKANQGLLHRFPFFSTLFLLAALSLAGLPPFSGFYCKYALVVAAIDQQRYFLLAVAIITGLLTLASMVKIWMYTFWGAKDESAPAEKGVIHRVVFAVAGWSAIGLLLAVLSGPVMSVAAEAGEQLSNPTAYIDAVLGEKAGARFEAAAYISPVEAKE